MRLESGPLSAVLDAKAVREAAAPFERLLVRVPEAYPLLGPYEATRPGLLVLDADGRRVDSLALAEDSDPAAIAKWLRQAQEAPARERFILRVAPLAEGGTIAGFVEALSKVEGVKKAEAQEDGVLVLAKAGALRPDSLARFAAEAKVEIEVLEPAPVALLMVGDADLLSAARSLAQVPGVWAVAEEEKGLRAWVTRLLLDPAALAKALPVFEADVEERRYAIPGVSPGPTGMKVATAVQDLPGVLAVRPVLAAQTVTVVGRKGAVSWPAVLQALRGTGLDAREDP